ncbi:MAG: hypothetical protein AAFY20_10575 [Cyanobacteria bacterium J06639_14]
MSQLQSQAMAGGRSQDPNYKQVSGHIPKDKLLKFKVVIAQQETTLSEALEQAVDLWILAVERGDDLPELMERVDKRRSSPE